LDEAIQHDWDQEAIQARQVLLWDQEAIQARQVLLWDQEASNLKHDVLNNVQI
jgi:hypothetical protein